jgi:hypothetical protein
MSFSDYAETAICNWIRNNAAMPAPAQPYCALFSNDPGEAGAGTEVTTTIRPAGRVAIIFGAPADGVMANSADVDFGAADAGATVTHFAIFDAAADGNMLMYAALDAPRTVLAADPVSFPVGALGVTVS